GQHAWVFGIGGVLMIGAGLAMLAGRTFTLPMVGGRAASGGGVRSVYALGVFSGGASACCAPVLVGVATLAGATASFPVALTIGITYVFGMVAPLALVALVWDRRAWGSSRLLRDRTVSVGRRHLPLATALSAGLMVVMGIVTSALAVTGQGMATSGWQVGAAATLQHWAAVALDALAWAPSWAGAAAVLAALALLVTIGLRQRRGASRRVVVPRQTQPDREGLPADNAGSTSLETTP
ncbi:MAG: cytochrome c biogenesis protein CcdA, partial [Actinomycetota bacterium]